MTIQEILLVIASYKTTYPTWRQHSLQQIKINLEQVFETVLNLDEVKYYFYYYEEPSIEEEEEDLKLTYKNI